MDSNDLTPFFYHIFHPDLPRHGPGDDASTTQALDTLLAAGLARDPQAGPGPLRVLDIGCGVGPQTICLAKHLSERMDVEILATDNHEPFLDELLWRTRVAGVDHLIQPRRQDMHTLDPSQGPFDLIWSEGAFFVMGFAKALETCRALLSPGGMLAASELVWLRSDLPGPLREFFSSEYPDIQPLEVRLAQASNLGYEILGHFTIPERSWWDNYRTPLEKRIALLREQNPSDQEKLDLLARIEKESEIYRAYSAWYGNEFFLLHKL